MPSGTAFDVDTVGGRVIREPRFAQLMRLSCAGL